MWKLFDVPWIVNNGGDAFAAIGIEKVPYQIDFALGNINKPVFAKLS